MSLPQSSGYEQATIYHLAQRVDLLRQLVYSQTDPSAATTLLEELLAAEADLRKAQSQVTPSNTSGLLIDSTGKAERPAQMSKDTTQLDLKVLLRQAHVPTAIVHLLDARHSPLVSYQLEYTGPEYKRLRLVSFVEGYSTRAIDTVELTYKARKAEVHQLPTFFPQKIRPITELTRATLHVRVDDLDGGAEQHSSFPIWMLARTSAVLGLRDPATGDWVDLAPYLAAWVTPNAPAVMQVLRRALDLHPNRRIVGYLADAAGVIRQVQVIFEALKEKQIQYANSVLSFGAAQDELMQRVRLPSESLANLSANCIDGTVLFASVLEAASLHPAIVLVPGHAFLAWEVQVGSDRWDYLETTMIGSHDFNQARQAGQSLAQSYQVAGTLRLLPLEELRTKWRVTPME